MRRTLLGRVQNYQLKQQQRSYNLLSNHLISTNIVSQSNNIYNQVLKESFEPWLNLISILANGGTDMDLALYEASKMLHSGIKPNDYSLVHLVRISTDLGYISYCQQLHCCVLKSGFASNAFVSNALMRFYRRIDLLCEADKLFVEIPQPSVISWNSMISGYVQTGKFRKALGLFLELHRSEVCCNEYSFTSALAACGQLGFLQLGYVNRNRPREALRFFNEMHSNDVQMDEFSFSIILNGIASLSALTWGILTHCCTIKRGLDTSVVVGSALIDTYSKCGQIKNAESMFQSLPKKNLVTWNAMISGYAHNGDSTKAIQLFEQLKTKRDLNPDWVTFLNVLAGCSQNETPLQQVYQYFESMINDYGIQSTVEHCCCLIRLMGQRGETWRAGKLIYELGFGPCAVVWKALLGACGVCTDMKVAMIAAAKVIELEGYNDYVYVMMSNIFAYYHKWGQMSVMRKLMREQRVIKEAACSWIEMENVKQ
ncbi:hypothetical protein V6Z12_A11G027800 [Gossypium hirsutum]